MVNVSLKTLMCNLKKLLTPYFAWNATVFTAKTSLTGSNWTTLHYLNEPLSLMVWFNEYIRASLRQFCVNYSLRVTCEEWCHWFRVVQFLVRYLEQLQTIVMERKSLRPFLEQLQTIVMERKSLRPFFTVHFNDVLPVDAFHYKCYK